MKLLHVDSSILGANSVSRLIASAIVDRIRQAKPDVTVLYRDLIATPLDHLTLTHLPADAPASDESTASKAILDEFMAADVVVIGAPMYNFTIPSQLKAWIDRIVIAGKTFRYRPDGSVEGLAGAKRVILALSRGGYYGPGTPSASAEHLESYLRAIFAFIGITPEFVIAEGIQIGPEQRKKAIEDALSKVSDLTTA